MGEENNLISSPQFQILKIRYTPPPPEYYLITSLTNVSPKEEKRLNSKKKQFIKVLTDFLSKESTELKSYSFDCEQVEADCEKEGVVKHGLTGHLVVTIHLYNSEKDKTEEFKKDPSLTKLRFI